MDIAHASPTPARRYGGASAAERARDRRERLMEAAFEVFGRQGYRQTTMRLICAQARLADRYFYEHFDSTHACYVAVHSQACEAAALAVEAAIRSLPGDFLLRARGGLTAFFEHIRADVRRARILILDSSASGLSARQRVDLQYRFVIDLLKSRFRLKYPHVFAKPDFEYVLTGCMGMLTHNAMLWIEREFSDPIDTVVDHTHFAWAGLDNWMTQMNAAATSD